MGTEKTEHNFLLGGGEMGKLIRAKDWSSTPLGDPKTWPQSLRTMVSVMLDNPFGMYIAWGKEYTQIYNDGYRPILGASKHPQALGISTKETFSEIWHIIESMFAGVMDGIPVGFPDFMLPLDRNGYVETCYFDFAYSPIRLENGEVGGVLVTVIETTEKKKAVEDLKESEERFRTMAEGTDIFIAVGDESSNATYFNKAWIDLTGRPLEELLEFGWLDLVHPEDREPYLNIYLDAFHKREPFTGEFRVLNRDGEYRWLLAQGPPRFRPDGSFAGYISSCVDITAQKTIEIELNESKGQLLFAIDAAELGTWDYNPISNKFSANHRLKEWFGLPGNKEMELSDAVNIIKENDRNRVTAAIQKALQYDTGGNYDVEYSIIHPDSKKETIVHAKGRAWFNENKIAYRLNGILEDITEKALAKKKKNQTDQHIRTMVLESPVGICVMDAATLVSEIVNESFIEIAGKPREAIEGKFYWDTFSEAREDYEELLNKVVETGEAYYANEVEMLLIRHGKEDLIYVTFVYAPLKDENDKVVKVAVWVLENTAQVEARKEIMVSENNLRLMILQAPMAIAILRGQEYKVEIANKYALELWGRTEEQVLNLSVFESMPELSTQGIKELLDDVTNTGKRFATSELPIQLLRNGILEDVYINFSYEALYDGEGNVNGIMAIGFDVTPQVESRKRAEESEKRYNLMLMQSPFAFLILKGKDMVAHLANESMIEVLGKGPDIIGKPLLEFLPEIKGQAFPELLNQVYTTGIPYSANEMLAKLMRNGKLEDVYFNYVYQPYYEVDQTISGVTVIAYNITSAVLANKKIELSEKRFRNLIAQAIHPILIFRGEDLILEIANEALFKLWRVDSEALGKPFLEILPEMKEQPFIELLLDVFHNGVTHVGNEQPAHFSRPNGEEYTVYFNFIYLPFREPDGHISGVLVQAYDVTNQVLARKKIEESEQNIRTLVESAPFPFGVFTGEEMRISLANQTIMDVWGKGNDVVGKLYTDILPELENQEIFEQVRSVLNTGTPFHARNQRVDLHKNGELKPYYFNYSFTPLVDANGNVNAVLNTAAEVTELHEAKQKVEEALSEIKLFKFMAETAADPFILMDEDGRFVYLNKSALEKWGYTNEEMAALKVPDVDIIYHEKKYKEAFKRAQRETLPPFETLHKNKQGDIYPVEINMGGVQVDNRSLLFAIARDITERKKAEQDVIDAFKKVEESEKRFRDSVKQAPLAISIFRGPDNITEMVNDHYLMIIDKTEEEFVGKPLFEALPHVEESIAPIIANIYKTETAFYGNEFPVTLNRQGKIETLFFNFVYHPLKENNTITGIMVVATEVTATVKAKHIIAENEEKLKLIIEASELGVFDVDLKSGEINASDRCYEILGFPTESKLTHKDLITNLHPDDLNLRNKAFEKAFKIGTLHYQARVIWKDQSIHWIDAKGKVFYDSNKVPERMLGTVRDVTEERNFQQQLLEREEKFRLLADSMPQHIWTSDPAGNLNYFNQSVYDYSGLSSKQLKENGWIEIVHPDDREENNKQWAEAIRTGKDFLFEHRFRKHTGEYRWQLSRAIPQKDIDGVIRMWVGTSTDIQDQKMFTNELESQVQQRTNELHQKNIDLEKINKELQSFVYISSHDLQEPLRKIQTFSSRIVEREYATLSDNAKKYFERMQNSAQRMQNLIQDLFAYSRTTIHERKYELVDLQAIIEDIQETLNEDLEQKHVSIEMDKICELKIIPFQFKQLLLNLVSNSIKFAKADHPVQIKIDCEIVEGAEVGNDLLSPEKQYYHIRFADNGIGFEQQYSGKIFEVFQRLHHKEEYTGTGIGLAIVKKIVENHDGVIEAKSELNQGATFDIYIPV